MNLIRKVINKILSIYYRSSGERLLSYYKRGGGRLVKVQSYLSLRIS